MKISKVEDYVDIVHEKFPAMSKDMILFVLKYGLKKYQDANSHNIDVSLISYMNDKCYRSFTGKLFLNPKHIVINWKSKWKSRLKYMYKENPRYDTIYYFGLTEEEFLKYFEVLLNPNKLNKIHLKKVMFCKNIEDVCIWRNSRCIIQIDWGADLGYISYQEEVNIPTNLIKPLYMMHNKYSLIPFNTKAQLPLWNKKLIQHLTKVLWWT